MNSSLSPAIFAGRPFFEWTPPTMRNVERLCRQPAALAPVSSQSTEISREAYFGACAVAASPTTLGTGWRSHVERAPAIGRAANLLASRSPSLDDFLAAHREVTDASSGLRLTPIWVDSLRPADAWYVGPPAKKLPSLLVELSVFLARTRLRADVAAAIAMLRMLQIHPFPDGNGRLARALFLGQWLNRIGPEKRAICYLSKLYQASGSVLHDASLSIRDRNDWQPFLELCARCLTDSSST